MLNTKSIYKLLFENFVSYIGIDVDSRNAKELLTRYFNARRLFPTEKVSVQMTKKGFHIKIHKRVTIAEDICWRSYLFDEGARVCMSIRRLLSGDTQFFDLLFDTKNGNSVKPVNMDMFEADNFSTIIKMTKFWDKGNHKKVDELITQLSSSFKKRRKSYI